VYSSSQASLRRARFDHQRSHSGPKVAIIWCGFRDFRGSRFQVASVESNRACGAAFALLEEAEEDVA
jgi:hypothetical protein